MDPSMIKKTQDTIGKVIKKPPLTEKLLNKPPFRFLHDIITEVIKNTSFLKGLYVADELNSSKVTDKDAKINFLQKAIDCAGFVTGEVLGARPSKIVAGHEPEKTNEFLQTIGRACLKKLDSQEAVKKVLAGEKPSAKSSSAKKERLRSSSKEKDIGKDTEKKDREERKERDDKRKSSSAKDKDKDRKRKESEPDRERNKTRERDREKEKDHEQEKERGRERKEKENDIERETDKESEAAKEKEREKAKESERRKEKDRERVDKDEEADDLGAARNIQRPSSAKGQRRRPSSLDAADKENEKPIENKQDDEEEPLQVKPDVEIRNQSAARRPARPSSARPAPPKIKKQEEQEDPIARLGSGKQNATVIVDNGKDQDDDEDDTFVIQDVTLPEDSYADTTPLEESSTDVSEEDHGILVRKMLESKREAETVQQKGPHRDKERPVILDATRKKEKELAHKEIEKLRNSIQTLCRSAHPLGKIMDYLQEDIDSMQKELEVWKKENQKHKMALKAEQSITESEIEPLHAQQGELELEITDMLDKISGVKSNIVRNDEKIQELVLGVSR